VRACVRADYWGYGHQSSTDFSEVFRSHPQILGLRMLRKHLPQPPSKVDFGIRMSGIELFWVFAVNTRWNGRIRTRGFCVEAQILFICWFYFYVHLPHLTPCLRLPLTFLLHSQPFRFPCRYPLIGRATPGVFWGWGRRILKSSLKQGADTGTKKGISFFPAERAGISTRYGLDDPWIESRRGRDFLLPSRPVLGSTQPPIQWVPNAFPGGKTAGTWRWPPTPYSAEVKERVERYLSFLSGPLWLIIWRTLSFPAEGWSDWNRTRSVFSCSTEDLVVECPVNVVRDLHTL
jgi:hypothetical protein